MLDGITVLKKIALTITETNTSKANILELAIIGILLIGTILFGVFLLKADSGKSIAIIAAIFIIFVGLCRTGFFYSKTLITYKDVPTGKYKYHVTIDDSVDLVELYKEYEVIDVKGEIYIIKDK